jgi:hypothetical protein
MLDGVWVIANFQSPSELISALADWRDDPESAIVKHFGCQPPQARQTTRLAPVVVGATETSLEDLGL